MSRTLEVRFSTEALVGSNEADHNMNESATRFAADVTDRLSDMVPSGVVVDVQWGNRDGVRAWGEWDGDDAFEAECAASDAMDYLFAYGDWAVAAE